MGRFGLRLGWGWRQRGRRCLRDGPPVSESTLLSCPLRTEVTIRRLGCQHGCGQRLRELGIVEGARLTVLRRSDPLVLMVKDVRIALDPATAGCIEIEAC